jgi:hypothetical protein
VVLIPSLGYLFGMVLSGRFDEDGERTASPSAAHEAVTRVPTSRALAVLFPLGIVALAATERGAVQAVAVTALLIGAAAAVHLLTTADA